MKQIIVCHTVHLKIVDLSAWTLPLWHEEVPITRYPADSGQSDDLAMVFLNTRLWSYVVEFTDSYLYLTWVSNPHFTHFLNNTSSH